MGYHHWRRLREMADWLLGWAHLPDGMMGATDDQTRALVLDRRRTQAQRRCTIAHELGPVRRGAMPPDPVLAARAAVGQAAARRLISLEALMWSRHPHEVAEGLWLDVPTRLTRLKHLHPAERALLIRRTGARGAVTIDPKTLLELALHGNDQEGVAATGLSRTRLLHRALVAAHDPEVALQHPELVQAVRAKLADSRRRSRRAA